MKLEKLIVPFDEGTRISVLGEHERFTRELINAWKDTEKYEIVDYGDTQPLSDEMLDSDGGVVVYVGKQPNSIHPEWLDECVSSKDCVLTYSYDVLNYSQSWLGIMDLREEIFTEFAEMLPDESPLKLKLLVILEEAP